MRITSAQYAKSLYEATLEKLDKAISLKSPGKPAAVRRVKVLNAADAFEAARKKYNNKDQYIGFYDGELYYEWNSWSHHNTKVYYIDFFMYKRKCIER